MHWKPCSGLLSDGCVCTNYEIVKKNILTLIDKRGMEEGATHSFSYKIFFYKNVSLRNAQDLRKFKTIPKAGERRRNFVLDTAHQFMEIIFFSNNVRQCNMADSVVNNVRFC